MIQITPEQK